MEEYDDYYEEEEQDGEAEEEYEEEEERKPTAEELEYLELRKRIKEQIRKKMQRENGFTLSKSKENKKQPVDNYGSFFGPSQPVIAQRVIQESKSLLENPRMAVRVVNGYHTGLDRKNSATTTSSRNGIHDKLSRVQEEGKMKVQKLKDTRDYSFLLSDDAEAPTQLREPKPQSTSASKSETHSTQVPQRIKQLSGSSGRNIHGDCEEKKSISANGQMHSKTGSSKAPSGSKSNSVPVDSRRHLSSHNGKPLSRPAGAKGLPSNGPVTSAQKKSATPVGKISLPAVHKQQNSLPAVCEQPSSLPAVRKQPSSLPGVLKRPSSLPGVHKQQSSLPAVQKQPSRMQSSVANQRFEQRKPLQEHKAKVIPKQQDTYLKLQINKPGKQASSHPLRDDNRPKKRPARLFSDDEDEMALSMIRSMFNTKRFAGRDDDDSDMEANFDDIMREERRSALIARKEDEEQLRLIEEEERRERMRKMAKRRKLGQ